MGANAGGQTLKRICVLVKQVPKLDEQTLGPDGRLVRAGLESEMNPYCRRAVAKGVELAKSHGATCTVVTLGPPRAIDCLLEAIAWGADDGVLVSDERFAGSDTLATAKALAATIHHLGPFDLILAGRNSVDSDTGQVAPQLAALLRIPCVTAARELRIDPREITATCEEDDGTSRVSTYTPAIVTCAERLCDPCKVPRDEWPAGNTSKVRVLTAEDLGPGPWGVEASPTRVGQVRTLGVKRLRLTVTGPVDRQVDAAMEMLQRRGALLPSDGATAITTVPATADPEGPAVACVYAPGEEVIGHELLGCATELAASIGGHALAVVVGDGNHGADGRADSIVRVTGAHTEWEASLGIAAWAKQHLPWAILLPGTMWGRHVAGRVAATLGAGLTGDAIELEAVDGRLVAWKAAFGGQLVAAVTTDSPVQMATVRPGVLPLPPPPARRASLSVSTVEAPRLNDSRRLRSRANDDIGLLTRASAVVGVGTGVDPAEYPTLQPLLDVLDAELAATRKVTDRGWLPRSRQVGITGHSIRPRLYIGVGLAGKFNHMVGVRGANTVLAVNTDPEAPVVEHADMTLVGDWRELVPALTRSLSDTLAGVSS